MGPATAAAIATAVFWTALAALVATYLGYPVFLMIIDPFRTRPAIASEPHTPSVTLVVPARNEAARIEAKVRNALEIDYPTHLLDVVVVDDGSEDGTGELALRAAGGDERVRVVPTEGPNGKARALNRGVAEATGEIVVFSDADSAVGRASLRFLVQPFVNPIVGCVAGRYFPGGVAGGRGAGVGLYWEYENYVRRKESQAGGILGASGALFGVRRGLYEPLKGDLINDDFVIPMRITARGYRSLYEPRAVAIEDESRNRELEFGRRVRIMAGNWQHLWFFRGMLLHRRQWRTGLQMLWHKGLRVLSPWFLMALAASNVAICVWAPDAVLYWVLLWGQTAFYGAAALGRLVQHRTDALSRAMCIPFYFAMINAAAFAGGWLFLFRGGRVRWSAGAGR